MCGRPAGSGTRAPRTPTIASSDTATNGACKAKIDSQPSSCVKTPPTAGPSARPATPASAHTRAAGASAPDAWVSRSSAAHTTAAPATPWTEREATSHSNDGANAQTSAVAANTSTPSPNTGTGRRRAMYAAGSADTASARLNDVSTQASVWTSTSYCPRISGSAIVTTDESARTIPTARPRSAMRCVRRALRRRTGSVYDVRSKAFFNARLVSTSARWMRYSPDA